MADTREERNESEVERLDRNFDDQLQEVRIAQAGVQILFAFLLTIAFQPRFADLTTLQRNLYLVDLGAAAVAVVLFTAPVATHRVVFGKGVKDFTVRYTAGLMSGGLVALGVAIVGSTVLVLDLLLDHRAAAVIGSILGLLALVLWLLVPWRRVRRSPDGTDAPRAHRT